MEEVGAIMLSAHITKPIVEVNDVKSEISYLLFYVHIICTKSSTNPLLSNPNLLIKSSPYRILRYLQEESGNTDSSGGELSNGTASSASDDRRG